MKLSQIAPMRWYHQVNLWTMNLSPWRYAALMASGIASGSALGQWLAGTDRSLAERFLAAARAAGIEARVTAHSGRVGRASELTARGASTTEIMLAGNWKTARMVAHYSAGATAERGAVRKYL